jgi:NitT/TauT family transport system ATP-binding protein
VAPPVIELRQVARTFRTTRGVTAALADVNLSIDEGELVTLVGPSGCGKTTILNLVAGLDAPDSGEVLVRGMPVDGPGPDRGVIFQEAALFPWLDIRENVEFGLKEMRVPRADRRRRSTHYLAMVGMKAFAQYLVHELSGGMRQRAALARALAMEPSILLMDEPFGALDARTREVLQEELVTIWRETGKTIVFVTHDMAEAVRIASRVVVLRARPARVALTVDIEAMIARPRAIEHPAVLALAAELKQDLDDDHELEVRLDHEERDQQPAHEPPASGDRDRVLPPDMDARH